eukprot:m.226280 g.226280  ORF g.226280 m.226280 type:complete len:655 (-) comp16913_c0_seq1:140-2104(-)
MAVALLLLFLTFGAALKPRVDLNGPLRAGRDYSTKLLPLEVVSIANNTAEIVLFPGNILSLSLFLSPVPDQLAETFIFPSSHPFSISSNLTNTSLRVLIEGDQPPNVYNSFLQNVFYRNTLSSPKATPRYLRVVARDSNIATAASVTMIDLQEPPTSPCSPSPCQNNGACQVNSVLPSTTANPTTANDDMGSGDETGPKYTCRCTPEWTGTNCTTPITSSTATSPTTSATVTTATATATTTTDTGLANVTTTTATGSSTVATTNTASDSTLVSTTTSETSPTTTLSPTASTDSDSSSSSTTTTSTTSFSSPTITTSSSSSFTTITRTIIVPTTRNTTNTTDGETPTTDREAGFNIFNIIAIVLAFLAFAVLVIIILVYRRRRMQQYNMGADLFKKTGSEFFFRTKPVFQVRVVRKVDGVPTMHPWVRKGCEFGYEVRQANEPWVAGRTIQLVRGRKYTFRLFGVGRDFPFYISYSEIGSGNGTQEYLQGVQGSPAIGNDTLTFTVPFDCPPLLYYQCARQKSMGGPIHVVDSEEPLLEVVSQEEDSVVSEHPVVAQPEQPPPQHSAAALALILDSQRPKLPDGTLLSPSYLAPPTYTSALDMHRAAADVAADRACERPPVPPVYTAPPNYDFVVNGRANYRQPAAPSEERKKSD